MAWDPARPAQAQAGSGQALPALTQLVLNLHRQVVGVHDDTVFGGCLHGAHHCEEEKAPGVCVSAPTLPGPQLREATAAGQEEGRWVNRGTGSPACKPRPSPSSLDLTPSHPGTEPSWLTLRPPRLTFKASRKTGSPVRTRTVSFLRPPLDTHWTPPSAAWSRAHPLTAPSHDTPALRPAYGD